MLCGIAAVSDPLSACELGRSVRLEEYLSDAPCQDQTDNQETERGHSTQHRADSRRAAQRSNMSSHGHNGRVHSQCKDPWSWSVCREEPAHGVTSCS